MRIMKVSYNKSGFTLVEIFVSIIIVGVISAIALPKIFRQIEISESAEGIEIIKSLKDAQVLYKFENGAYTTSIGNLDLSVSTNLNNFKQPLLRATNPVAYIEEEDSKYTLCIDDTGNITCTGSICTFIGYASTCSLS